MPIKNWLVVTLALAAIVTSLFFLLHTPTEKSEQVATNVSEALGLRAAEEVAQLIGNKGQVAVLEMEIKPGQAPTAVASMEIFRKMLKKHGVAIARTKSLPGGITALVMGGGISRNDYISFVEASPNVNAVISFAGLPNLPKEEFHEFQSKHPLLVVVDIFGTLKGSTLSDLVGQKAVALGFAPRSAPEVEQQGNEPKLFERYYKIFRSPSK